MNRTKAENHRVTQAPKRRRALLGPGLTLSIFAAGAILLTRQSGFVAFGNSNSQNAGRVVFAADEQGHLQRVDDSDGSPRRAFSAERRLPWKPEPGFLLEKERLLGLTADQRERITREATGWQAEKTRLAREISQSVATVEARLQTPSTSERPGMPPTLPTVQANLQDYASLSRQYNAVREAYWQAAFTTLTPAQQHTVQTLAANQEATLP